MIFKTNQYSLFFLRRIIQAADTADEFYCVMGQLSQEMLDYQASDSNKLIKVSLCRIDKKSLMITNLFVYNYGRE